MRKLFNERSVQEEFEEVSNRIMVEIHGMDMKIMPPVGKIVAANELGRIGLDLEGQKLGLGELSIPVSGPRGLFCVRPDRMQAEEPESDLEGSEIVIRFDVRKDSEDVSAFLQKEVDIIKGYIKLVNGHVDEFNKGLPDMVAGLLKEADELQNKTFDVGDYLESIILPS